MEENERLLEYLEAIDPASASYTEWVEVGMALKHEGVAVDVWDAWSRKDQTRYKAGECEKKWASFNEGSGGSPVTGGTLFQMAISHGWEPPAGEALAYDFGDEVDLSESTSERAHTRKSPSKVEFVDGEVRGGLTCLPAAEQTRLYLETLFLPSEIVGFVVRAKKDEKRPGKWVPASKGVNTITCDRLVRDIEKCRGDLSNVFGNTTPEAGAWVRINPLDGQGCGNTNVQNFKYALVESDTLPMARQWELYQRLNLPCAAILTSGGKSVHAIVRVDARDIKEYYARVDKLYSILKGEGIEIDNQNRNPSRLSRLPGIMRGSRMQSLIAIKTGAKDWESWIQFVREEIENDDLGDFENCLNIQAPHLKDELIPGILRKGHKMLIAGPSKAGKSFLLLELAVCIAGGLDWVGLPVKKGRVLYINLEIDPDSFLDRAITMMRARNLPQKDAGNLDVWNLRGRALPLDQLVPKLIRRARNREYAAVIVDPIYKILTGDENSASEMGAFTNNFDRICAALGCAVIYCHHHSKGQQGQKRAIDRASGSGVFARDPDALLDLMEVEKRPRDEARLREIGANAALTAAMRRTGFVARKDGRPWPDAPESVYESQARCAVAEYLTNAGDSKAAEYPEMLAKAWELYTRAKGRPESGAFIAAEADRHAGFTAWTMEASVREFAPPKPRYLWFTHPVHAGVDPRAGDELTLAFMDMASGRRRRTEAAKEDKKDPAEENAAAILNALEIEAASRRMDGREDAEIFTREDILQEANRVLDKPVSAETLKKWLTPGTARENPWLIRGLEGIQNTPGKKARYRLLAAEDEEPADSD